MKNIIAELDKISAAIEEFEQPWAYNIVWRLDKITMQLEEMSKAASKFPQLNKVKEGILSQYLDRMIFLGENETKLKDLILKHDSRNASEVYNALKKHFGSLSRGESEEFIKNVFKNLK